MDFRDGTVGFVSNTISKGNKRYDTGHTANWKKVSDNHVKELGPLREKLHAQFTKPLQWLLSRSFGIFTESLSSRMIRSKSALAEWAAFNLFNVPSGTGGMIAGRDSATLLQKGMLGDPMNKLNKARVKALFEYSTDVGANMYDHITIRNAQSGDGELINNFYKMVYQEINDRRLGKGESDRPLYIKEYANAIKGNNDAMYDLQLKNKITGITGTNKIEHYIQQRVDIDAFTNAIEIHGEEKVTRLFRDALEAGGTENAVEMADELIKHFKKPQAAGDFNLIDLIAKGEIPNKDTLLKGMGIKAQSRDASVEMPAYMKKRSLSFDFNTTNGELDIIDLFEYDVSRLSEEYATKATGLSSMSAASGGNIRSYADVESMLEAMAEESTAAGTALNVNDVRQELRIMLGLPTDNVRSNDLSRLMNSASLKMLGGLTEAQLADGGAILAKGQSGIVGGWQALKSTKHKMSQNIFGTKLEASDAANVKHLNDLQELTGFMDDAHIYSNTGVDLQSKAADKDANMMRKVLNMSTGGQTNNYLQYLQGRYSGFGAVRSALQQASMATVLEVYAKHIRGDIVATDRLRHVGLINQAGDVRFQKYFQDGTVKYDSKNRIASLGLDKWSEADRMGLGASLTRAIGDDVLEGFAGELAPELRKPFFQFLFQFKSIPMLAAEKFQAKELKFGDKQAAMGIFTNMLFAGMGRYIRYHSMSMAMAPSERDDYLEKALTSDNMMASAFGYTNVAGVIPLVADYSTIITGNSQYGEGRVGGMLSALPSFTAMSDLGAIEGIGKIADGDLTEARKHFALGTMALGNMATGIALSLTQ
jgi:hypothetical protein